MKRYSVFFVLTSVVVLMWCSALLGQGMLHSREKIDSAATAQIKEEGMSHSQVMEILSYLSDVYGPRLTGSPEYKQAAEWASTKLRQWGLQNVHFEKWGPFGKGWTLKRFSANVTKPRVFPLIAYPKAWSSGTGGTVEGEVI